VTIWRLSGGPLYRADSGSCEGVDCLIDWRADHDANQLR